MFSLPVSEDEETTFEVLAQQVVDRGFVRYMVGNEVFSIADEKR